MDPLKKLLASTFLPAQDAELYLKPASELLEASKFRLGDTCTLKIERRFEYFDQKANGGKGKGSGKITSMVLRITPKAVLAGQNQGLSERKESNPGKAIQDELHASLFVELKQSLGEGNLTALITREQCNRDGTYCLFLNPVMLCNFHTELTNLVQQMQHEKPEELAIRKGKVQIGITQIKSADDFDEFESRILNLEKMIRTQWPEFQGLQIVKTPLKNNPVFSTFDVTLESELIASKKFASQFNFNSDLYDITDSILVRSSLKGPNDLAKMCGALLSNVITSSDSRSFQFHLLKLAHFYQLTEDEHTELHLDISMGHIPCVIKIVRTSNAGPTELGKVQFNTQVKLNDWLFEQSPLSAQTYKLKADSQELQKIYIKTFDLNALWNSSQFSTVKKIVLREINEPPAMRDLEQIRLDMHRATGHLPSQKEINDERVVTQESLCSMVRTYFRPVLEGTSPEFQALYKDYSELDLNTQIALCSANDVNQKQEKHFLTNGLIKQYKERFDALSETEQNEMRACFNYFALNEYKGTQEQFNEALQQLPLKEKVISLIGLNQNYKSILEALGSSIKMNSKGKGILQKKNDIYFFKIISVNQQTGCVVIEVEYQTDFELSSLDKLKLDKPKKVAREFATVTYTVTLPESGQLVAPPDMSRLNGATVHLHEETLKFNLVFLNQDETIPYNSSTV